MSYFSNKKKRFFIVKDDNPRNFEKLISVGFKKLTDGNNFYEIWFLPDRSYAIGELKDKKEVCIINWLMKNKVSIISVEGKRFTKK